MIIYKLHIVCITILPSENYAPLAILGIRKVYVTFAVETEE